MSKRIIFTGGSGKAGRHVVPYLLDKGHEVLNLDLVPLAHPGVTTLKVDLRDSGQVFNALSMHFDFKGLESGTGPAPVDAVVHFAAVPRILLQPDNVTFETNVVSTYNVIEAAVKLGIRKIIIASSETTYGVCFAEGDKDFHGFPLDEDYDEFVAEAESDVAEALRKLRGAQGRDPAAQKEAARIAARRAAQRWSGKKPQTKILLSATR